MADIKQIELVCFEELFDMGSGYVLDFSNNAFRAFILSHTKIDIYDNKYSIYGDSKAKRLRAFLKIEDEYIVSKVLDELLEYWRVKKITRYGEMSVKENNLYTECKNVISRLSKNSVNIEVLATEEENFQLLFDNIKLSIENGQADAAIDRLHTYMVKFIRSLCNVHNINFIDTEPLHNIFGKYVKYLENNKILESEMSIRILKSNIKILDSFNFVRNNQSLSHDNIVLNYDECIYIFNSIIDLKLFIDSIEGRIN